MVTVTLPDGSQRHFESPPTAADVAAAIGKRLRKDALAAAVDGQLVDLRHQLTADATVRIITAADEDGLAILRHSCAHLLAQAVKRRYPTAQIAIGPVIADGFYYDIDCDTPLNDDALVELQQDMQALIEADLPVHREILDREQALSRFAAMGETYKTQIIEALPPDDVISVYAQGDFVDLCRGPHIPSTGAIPKDAFRLTHVAGAYWRGNADGPMLQRIYGTCWPNAKLMDAYFARRAEAERRDHRKLGRQLDLFHLQEEAPGMVFWHRNGYALYHQIEQYLRHRLVDWGYQEVKTPQILSRKLWVQSGHWDKFGEHMFTTASEGGDYAVKPMNCPCHVQIFNQRLHSYRELPLRMAEFGSCHRNEPSGALHGLMRVRNFVQDDGHIFCTPSMVQDEVAAFIHQLFAVYRDFGFGDQIQVKLSTRPTERIGDEALWDRAEQALATALDTRGIAWELQPGEGAFYGPKIEFSLIDCLDRVWQCGTMQVDFFLPERLGAYYVDEHNSKQHPVMLHRAIVGSLERFVGILIEHYAGVFPLWLAPVQVRILTIADKHADYARAVAARCHNAGLRVDCDLRSEKIGYKIRAHTAEHIPCLLIVGDTEVADGTIAARVRGHGDVGTVTVDACIDQLRTAVANRVSDFFLANHNGGEV